LFLVCHPFEVPGAYVALSDFSLRFLQCQSSKFFIDSMELALQGEFHYSNYILYRKWDEEDKQTVEV
jgi:hypothetical protein